MNRNWMPIALLLTLLAGAALWFVMSSDPVADRPPVTQINLPDEDKPAPRQPAMLPAPSVPAKSGPEAVPVSSAPTPGTVQPLPATSPTPAPGTPAPSPATPVPPEAAKNAVEISMTVHGRVVESSGAGVEGATIAASPSLLRVADPGKDGGGGGDSAGNGHGHTHKGIETVPAFALSVDGSVTSGLDGQFTLAVEGKAASGTTVVAFQVSARKDGMASGKPVVLNVAVGGEVRDVVLSLYQPARIFGVVLESDGDKPVAGATVALTQFSEGTAHSASYRAHPATTTGADGSFAFENLSPGGYHLSASMPGMSATSDAKLVYVQLAEGAGEGPRNLYLSRTARLLFRLSHDIAGKIGAILVERDTGEFSSLTGLNKQPEPANRLEDGGYAVEGLRSDHTHAVIRADGFAPTTFAVRPVAGQDFDLGAVTLDMGATLEGCVVDGTGQGVAGAAVKLLEGGEQAFLGMFSGASDDIPNARTDTSGADGRFTFANLASGVYALTVNHENYAAARANATIAQGAARASVTITLTAGGAVHGTVTLTDAAREAAQRGKPEDGGIRVALVPANNIGAMFMGADLGAIALASKSFTMAAADGGYEITCVSPGTYRVIATCVGLYAASEDLHIAEGEPRTVDLVIGTGGAVYGTVIGPDGRPVKGMKIYVAAAGLGGIIAIHHKNDGAVTDDAGNYRQENVRPGSYVVRLEGEEQNFDAAFNERRRVDMPASGGDVRKDIDLSVVSGVRFHGRITLDGKGGVFNDAMLIGTGAGRTAMRAIKLDKDGAFDATGLSPGRYYFGLGEGQSADSALFVREPVEIKAGATDIVFERNYRSASLRGTVTVAGDATFPLNTVSIRVQPVFDDVYGHADIFDMMAATATCGADGAYGFAKLVEGRYTVMASASGFAPMTAEVMVTGEALHSLLLSARGGGFELTIAAIEGDATAGAASSMFGMVMLLDEAGKQVPLPQTKSVVFGGIKAGARIAIDSLAPGRYTLKLADAAIEPTALSIEVRAGETTAMQETLHRAASICLTVTNSEVPSEVIQAASVEAFDTSGAPVGKGAGFDELLMGGKPAGRDIVVSPLMAGRYRVVVKVEGFAPWESTVEVARSSVVTKDITLVPSR